jgi:hypothetical protein
VSRKPLGKFTLGMDRTVTASEPEHFLILHRRSLCDRREDTDKKLDSTPTQEMLRGTPTVSMEYRRRCADGWLGYRSAIED